LAVSLERTPRSDTILIETDNGDNPAIELHDFRGYYPATRVIFTSARSQPTQPPRPDTTRSSSLRNCYVPSEYQPLLAHKKRSNQNG
jgi:hypothetical protein